MQRINYIFTKKETLTKFVRCSWAEKKRGIIIYQYARKNFFAQYLMTRLPDRSKNFTVVKKWVEDAMV